MEEKNRKTSVALSHAIAMSRTSTFWIGLFAACYLAVLPMADTIALRNLALFALLLCLGWHFRKSRPSLQWPLPLLLWVLYLLVFPLIADSHTMAFESLQGQWGAGVLAMLAGAGVAAIFYNKDKGAVLCLGMVSAVPILVHLSLFIWRTWTTSSIPWGYWGRETHHADLGYAAGQSVVLLTAAIVAGRKKTMRPLALALIVACLLSTALAHSRAGLAFSLIGGLLVVGTSSLAHASYRQKHVLGNLIGIVIVGVFVLTMAVRNDVRWRNMTSEVVAGFYGDAIRLECEGTASIEPEVIARYGDQSQRIIASVQYGDGSRFVVLRAGLALALKHPWGSDGSRQAFQKLLRQECINPAISMAHTHNGWLDTVLALGWSGAILYLAVLLYFFRQGLTHLHPEGGLNEWVLVLIPLSIFWILRGFTDSVFRDHMLEMQGFVLAFALTTLNMQTQSPVSSSATQ
jgi:hypothetical protein